MNEETIVAVFDTSAHADAAVADLEAAGIPPSGITRHASTAGVSTGTVANEAEAAPRREPGFWSSLFGGEPQHDSTVYDRSLEHGSIVVTVRASSEHAETAMDILDRHHPVDLDERASGYGLGQGAATATTIPETAPAVGIGEPMTQSSVRGGQDTLPGGSYDPLRGGADQVMSLSEEQVSVGKRLVNRGTTRIHRFVVETPVEENVSLHSERVSIERRPAASGARVAEGDFTDRVVEMTETDEEAVVGKTAHVREEVVIHKEGADRTETVRETARREDVEVTQDGAKTTLGGAAGTSTTRP